MYVCEECKNDFPESCDRCPHCARPCLYPNVRAAEKIQEVDALNQRYNDAMSEVSNRGAASIAGQFEAAVCSSKAVVARPVEELQRLTRSDQELYATYYELVDGGIRIPNDKGWDVIRVIADEALFHGYKEQIRFAALTLNDNGLPYYGDCYFVLRSDMIEHRTTVFEQNSAEWIKDSNVKVGDIEDLPAGYRASWKERGKLAIAKLSCEISATTQVDSFPSLLLQAGSPNSNEGFIEAHIYGDITIRTVEKVKASEMQQGKAKVARDAVLDMISDKLIANRVILEI